MKILCGQLNCRSYAYNNTSIFTPYFTFALKMTRASSRNVNKFYQTVKLSTENLCLQYFMQIVTENDVTSLHI